MGMPVEFNTLIVTKGKEVRIDENIFTLEKDGYRVYPMEIPMDVRKTKFGEKSGTAEVQKLASMGRRPDHHYIQADFFAFRQLKQAKSIIALGFCFLYERAACLGDGIGMCELFKVLFEFICKVDCFFFVFFLVGPRVFRLKDMIRNARNMGRNVQAENIVSYHFSIL